MCVRIRPAEVADLKDIYAIEQASFKEPYPYRVLKSLYILSGDLFLVAECKSKIVGYIIGLKREHVVGHIVSVAVHPRFRGMGIGSRLLQEELTRFREKGCIMARLEVRKSNKPAIRLYKKYEFKTVYIIKKYYKNEDCKVMVRPL